MDWKDALSSLRADMPGGDLPEAEANAVEAAGDEENKKSQKRSGRKLTLFYEKKGRAGKPATIIAGFDEDDDAEALDVARILKQKLGCGGSARGGEILLQGDRREQARPLLRDLGYKV